MGKRIPDSRNSFLALRRYAIAPCDFIDLRHALTLPPTTLRHKYPYCYPIVGGRKIEHLKGNIEALSIKLSPEEIEEIEDAAPFDVGFPMNFLFMGMKTPSGKGNDIFLTNMAAYVYRRIRGSLVSETVMRVSDAMVALHAASST